VQREVSVKDTLGFVVHGLANQSELSEGVDVTVDTNHANQFCWQGPAASLDGHCARRGRGMKRGAGGQGVVYNRFRARDTVTKAHEQRLGGAASSRMNRRVKGEVTDPIKPGRGQSGVYSPLPAPSRAHVFDDRRRTRSARALRQRRATPPTASEARGG
jgi:hypothetical protein